LITGASGSGKSSLMRAGVLARLRKEPARWITARPFRRGTDASNALAEALAWAFPPSGARPASMRSPHA
jgi:ribose 1,5-bisphosphokinase PhnN